MKECLQTNLIFLSATGANKKYTGQVLKYNQSLCNYFNYVNRCTQNCVLFVNICNGMDRKMGNSNVSWLLQDLLSKITENIFMLWLFILCLAVV